MKFPTKSLLAGCVAASMAAGCAVINADKAPVLADRTLMWAEATTADCELPAEISFSADGKISGDAGCNRLLGTYTLDGTAIDLSHIGSTRRMCGPHLMKIEGAFLKNLANTVKVTADGDNVLFWDKDGKRLMTLEPSAPGTCD